jgi:16S rRNA (cytidine1402-2'-O)-methyltransferase
MLYIVSTPIGNLKDISLRAVEVLKSVDMIACEDTRHTKILLDHYGIKKPTTSFFQHNRFTKAEFLLGLLREGKNIALVSDAGTPGILDPGYNLINLAVQNNISITAIPGATAFVDALVLSGKPAHEFFFAGFLPTRTQARKNKLTQLAKLKCTLVFYESCHRILSTLEDISTVFGCKEIVVCRELTKKFEEVKRGPAKDILEAFKSQKPRGEFVVLL